MNTFLKQHIKQSLAVVALLFLGLTAAYFVWGITTISLDVSQVTNATVSGVPSTVFDLQEAKKLNLKGLTPSQ